MVWNKHTQSFLETQVFKGRIVERRKGRGGLIYIIEQDAIPNRIAYKTIQEFETDLSVDTKRFDREARNWFEFSGHPLVIRPFFIKVVDNVPLICMPYCDGDLRNLVEERLSLTSVVCISLQIVKGMIVANTRGMDHHQDIKPANLLYVDLSKKYQNFPPEGVDSAVRYSVRIADFGVANAWQDNHPGGTNAYKAPEQHTPHNYNKFAPDIFAVGLVIAELFQGYHPAAKDIETQVSKWKGSKLKKWAIGGERHFSPIENPQAGDLVKLITDMLMADPSGRPSFQQCYGRLEQMLKDLSDVTFKQLNLLFEYFDCVANYCQLESEIEKWLKLAENPSELESVKIRIEKHIEVNLDGGVINIESALSMHHLLNALNRLCKTDFDQKDKNLLIEGSKEIVKFTLEHHKSITANCLWPSLAFFEPQPKKLASDIEAKAEILNMSIERLERFCGYEKELENQVNNGGNVIVACRIMNDASKMWTAGHIVEACNLLGQVRQLVPHEPELERLYETWISAKNSFIRLSP